VPARVVTQVLGHSQIALTSGSYSQVAPEAAERVAAAIGTHTGTQINFGTILQQTKPQARGLKAWSRLGESNPGPTHYECVALAN
jgi:hypothetical protein